MSSAWQQKAEVGLLSVSETEEHKIRIYPNRLAISRKDGCRLTWEELQQVKQGVWGDQICVEIYPAQTDVVNLRHTRHLWHSPEIARAVSVECVHPEFTNAKNN